MTESHIAYHTQTVMVPKTQFLNETEARAHVDKMGY